MRRATIIPVRIDGGETVNVAVGLEYAPGGALVRVVVPDAPSRDPREMAARRMLLSIDAQLRSPRQPGITLVQRECELLAELAQDLVDLEAVHGPAAVRSHALERGG